MLGKIGFFLRLVGGAVVVVFLVVDVYFASDWQRGVVFGAAIAFGVGKVIKRYFPSS